MFKVHTKAILFSSLNALVMLLLALYWLSLPRTFGDEAIFIKWTSLVKKSLLKVDKKPPPETVLYVDISGSKALLDIQDPLYEEHTGFHKQLITDREQLALFLQAVAKYGEQIPLVLFDISFLHPSPWDSLLQTTFDQFPFPVIGARQLLLDGTLAPSQFELPTGMANYLSTDNTFMKYPLFIEDTMPSLPLAAYRITHQVKPKPHWFMPSIDKRLSLANPIIDFKIRPFDINDGTANEIRPYHLRSLGTLLFEWDFWDEADIRALLRNKFIVVGDFKKDIHDTVFGSIPGPVIVHNAYLSLVQKENLISWKWLFLLYALFWWMSFRVYREEQEGKRSYWWHRSDTALGKLFADSIDDTFFLIIATILSYFLFNIHINILILLIYLKIVTYILKRFIFKLPNKPNSSDTNTEVPVT